MLLIVKISSRKCTNPHFLSTILIVKLLAHEENMADKLEFSLPRKGSPQGDHKIYIAFQINIFIIIFYSFIIAYYFSILLSFNFNLILPYFDK